MSATDSEGTPISRMLIQLYTGNARGERGGSEASREPERQPSSHHSHHRLRMDSAVDAEAGDQPGSSGLSGAGGSGTQQQQETGSNPGDSM